MGTFRKGCLQIVSLVKLNIIVITLDQICF